MELCDKGIRWRESGGCGGWYPARCSCGDLIHAFYACREREKDELLPWDVIDVGVAKRHLWHEREQAYASVLSPDCRKQCTGCGASALLKGGVCDA